MTVVDEVEALYREQYDPLVSSALLILRDRALAEDVVQSCFERFASRPRDGILRPSSYLRRMVVNDCYAVAKRRQREEPVAEPEGAAHLDPELADFDWALRALTPRRRIAIVLRYFDDLPVNEIAELMEARPSTVSSLLRRGLIDLKEVLR